LLKAAAYRLERQKAEASTKSAEASAQNARTLEEQRKFEQEQYPEKFKLEKRKVEADILRAGRPDEFQQRLRLYQTDPNAYNAMYGAGAKGGLTTSREEAIKNLDTRMGVRFKMMKPDEQETLIRQEMGGGAPAMPTGGGVKVTAPNGQTYSFPNAQAAQEFKKKAGIQ
jgi:hypothetical protein